MGLADLALSDLERSPGASVVVVDDCRTIVLTVMILGLVTDFDLAVIGGIVVEVVVSAESSLSALLVGESRQAESSELAWLQLPT
jgi:hypothetical protein